MVLEVKHQSLLPFDNNQTTDVFIHDRKAKLTVRANDGLKSRQPNLSPTISADGRYVGFSNSGVSYIYDQTTLQLSEVGAGRALCLCSVGRFVGVSTIALPGPWFKSLQCEIPPSRVDLFDRKDGSSYLIADGTAHSPALSGNGRFLAYVDRGICEQGSIAVYDHLTGITKVIHKETWWTGHPTLSFDGHAIAFDSLGEVLVWDRERNRSVILSIARNGAAANGASKRPSLSGDGLFVAFESSASNLTSDDTNEQWDIFVRSVPALLSDGFESGDLSAWTLQE